MTDRSKTVVMLIDWDNLQICHSRDAPGTELDLQALIALAQSYGTLVSARAYAEWNLLSERLAVYKAGIEPVFAPVMRPEGSPREGKSLADTVMVADGVDLLWTVAPDVFVLATSDKDMIPLARIAKQRGAAVVVLGSDLTAIPLVEMSNVFITYRQLLRELDRVSELEAPVGRAPARERRLRESRRPSSEPYGGGLGSGGAGFGGGQLGSGHLGGGSRGAPRPVGTMGGAPAAPATPLPGPGASRRRLQEPIAAPASSTPGEPDQALATSAPTPAFPEAAEPVGIGAADVAPRRRRRRGGRGRRSGVGGLGDGDVQDESQHETTDEQNEVDTSDEEDRGPASAESSSPDDFDSRVLQLLAAGDRDQSPAPAADTASEADEPAVIPSVGEVSTVSSPVEPELPAARRVVRTSFSSFGPPEVNIRPLTPASAPGPADTETAAPSDDEPVSAEMARPASAPASVLTEPDAGLVAEATAAAPNATESAASEPVSISVVSDAADATNGAIEPDAESAAPAAGRRTSRSGRAGRSGSGSTRRTRGSSTSSGGAAATVGAMPAEASADASSEGAPEAARTPRRRRTRRPASAAAEGTGESVAAETVVSETAASEAGA